MPTPLKSTQNMTKHLTKVELETRKAVEGQLSRRRVYVKAPAWLDKDALAIFEKTKKQLRGLGLLDNTDAELLGLYADAIARYKVTVRGSAVAVDPKTATAAQAWSRLALSFAEKLGISATARARLARKKAEQTPDDFENLLDDVSDFVNGDV